MQQPLVSVCIICYNNHDYIRQAVDSVLMQQVNFPWEIIIADDCSTDGTREVVKDYHRQYPGLFRLVLPEQNTKAKVFVDLIRAAKGKYIAYLEGDDYWTDPLKLQKQFDFMESHPDLSMCYHKINWTWTYPSTDDPNMESNEGDPPVSTVYDVLNKGWFIRSCTMFLRNFGLPPGFEQLYVGDYPMHVLWAHKGDIGFIPESMGVYRINDKGQSETKLVTVDIPKRSKNMRAEIELYKYIDYHTGYKYHSIFNRKQFDVLYSHLLFLKKNSLTGTAASAAIKDFIYTARSVGAFRLLKGIFQKVYRRVNK